MRLVSILIILGLATYGLYVLITHWADRLLDWLEGKR